MASFCESSEKNLVNTIQHTKAEDLRYGHLQVRIQTEEDFFALFCKYVEDKSNPIFISKGVINDPEYAQQLKELKPDVVISFGSSIIKPELIDAFPNKFINVHLGLSPYYRGSGSNFWPFVNNQPEYCGVTFMKIDSGIDTGEVIHQIRPIIKNTDSFHTICNRLLINMAEGIAELVRKFDLLKVMPQLEQSETDLYYKNSDFTESSVKRMLENFSEGMIDQYLENKGKRDQAVPIKQNPALSYE
jgi:methionyl-tRNA formyltransferase